MRRAIATLAFLLTACFLTACSSPPPGELDPTPFRDAGWGMTQVQVRARESSNQVLDVSNGRAVYADRVLGMVCLVEYRFEDDRLVAGGYTVREEHESNQGRVEDYLRFHKALTDEYGEGEEGTIWFNALYKNEYVKWGFALVSGHVVFRDTWEMRDTLVTLSLGPVTAGEELAVRVDYENRAWVDGQKERKRAAESRQL